MEYGAHNPERGLYWFLVSLLLVAGVFDLLTTWIGLGQGLREANPFAAGVLGSGFGALVLLKAVGCLLVVAFGGWMHRHGQGQYANTGIAIGAGVWGMAVAVNLLHIGAT